ncbi:MAG TPA: malectin domain-containing carbohydrate-binding protein, partial [Vicinamibacteria bacterium]|nr:malectin domain-containing carbohydrate-binding protein [Vicinamibacteria bacterium]
EGVPDEAVRTTLLDLRSALLAAKAAHAPFALATCGWVLGPPQDRTLFDRELPREVALSCINRTVGHSPVERGFAAVKDRPTWAIPWLEDDPALTAPQLWVGRVRRDAADARRYGTGGLIGIHWRTRAIGPNVAALAQAAWRQDWPSGPVQVEGPVGGYRQVRAGAAVADTREPDVYRQQRCGLAGYRLKLPNGRYDLRLRFAELERTRPGERVFDVTVQGRTVASRLDLARSPGPRTAFDQLVHGVRVAHGWLDVGFVDHQNVACLAAIEVEGPATRRIDVGGPALDGYEADLEGVPFVPTTDFWTDWAAHEFGEEAGKQAAAIFERLDSRLPRPVDWVDGPGGLEPDERPWWQAKEDYTFVDQLAALRPLVEGPLGQERFDYWLESFRTLRATGELACAYARLQGALAALHSAPAAEKRQRAETARQALRAMVPLVGAAMQHLLATVRTRGELGTVANWQQHLLPRVYEAPAREIAQALGRGLLPEDALPRTWDGPERLVVPTLRSSLERGEPLRLEALVVGELEGAVQLTWRRMGSGTWTAVPFARVARGVYRVTLPAPADDIEYFVQATPAHGGLLKVPAAGSAMPQTVVIGP